MKHRKDKQAIRNESQSLLTEKQGISWPPEKKTIMFSRFHLTIGSWFNEAVKL